MKRYLQADWYLKEYPDVSAANVEPFQHFVEFGAAEGRQPNPYFDTKWYAAQHMSVEEQSLNPLSHYEKHLKRLPVNPIMDPDFIIREYNLDADTDPLEHLVKCSTVDRVCSWFSRKLYVEANPDVAQAGMVPEIHLYRHGLFEGRPLGSDLYARRLDARVSEDQTYERQVARIVLSSEVYGIFRTSRKSTIVDQIKRQATIDPDVSSAGVNCLARLRTFSATDLNTRDLINYRELLDAVPTGIDFVVILPRLQIGGAEKYAANLAAALADFPSTCRTLVVTTDGISDEDQTAQSLELLHGLTGIKVSSIWEHLHRSHHPETILALLLLRSGAKHVFVVNSDVALRAVKKHGAALANEMGLYCAFFSETEFAIGAPYSARYIREILLHSIAISDNRPALEKWDIRTGRSMTDRFVYLPSEIRMPAADTFEKTISSRMPPENLSHLRVFWISRWEPYKAIDVVCEIARQCPDWTIYAFGPQHHQTSSSAVPTNIVLMGAVERPSDLPLQDYDVMIFTSYFEGMPTVVPEMASRGIAIVASDVGGLRDTFADGSINFVPMDGSVEQIASRFVGETQVALSKPPEAMRESLRAARRCVEQHHSTSLHRKSLHDLLSN